MRRVSKISQKLRELRQAQYQHATGAFFMQSDMRVRESLLWRWWEGKVALGSPMVRISIFLKRIHSSGILQD